MDLGDANSPTTRLLTLLNVSALKSKKCPTEDLYPREKLNKRKCPAAELRSEPDPSGLQNEATFQPSDDIDTAEQEVDVQGDQNDPACEPLPHPQFQGS